LISPDVNILVHAWNPESRHHEQARRWLRAHVGGVEPLGVSELVASGAVRVLSMPGVPRLGHSAADVLRLVDELLAAPGVVRLRAGARHWGIFGELLTATGATGNTVTDCYHAALALEHAATWVSRDRFFATVPGLDWREPW